MIEKNKINIYDIPIAEITDQYLEYVSCMEEESLDVVSEFLVMAATLLDIKARMLLPREVSEEGEEEDPRAELVERLLEYKTYKYMSLELKDMEVDADKVFYKAPTIPREVERYEEPVDLDQLLDGLTLSKLQKIFESVMKRREDKIDPVRSTFGTIKKEPVSLEEKIGAVLEYAERHRRFSFRGMLSRQRDKTEIVVTFLALLELMKMGRIHLTQEHLFDDMMIEALEPEGPDRDPGGGNRMRVEDLREQEAVVEAVLFTMGRSVEIRQLAAALETGEPEAEAAAERLKARYEESVCGMQVLRLENSYQMCTRTGYYENLIRVAAAPKKQVLSDVVLETLAIIAYKQPVTKADIEKIRGVKSDHAVNRLIEYNLVYEAGRLDAPGKPALFATTEEFLRRFGVSSTENLPEMDLEQKEEIRSEVEEELNLKAGPGGLLDGTTENEEEQDHEMQ